MMDMVKKSLKNTKSVFNSTCCRIPTSFAPTLGLEYWIVGYSNPLDSANNWFHNIFQIVEVLDIADTT